MEDFIVCITELVFANKEWLFSGIGVMVLALVGRFFIMKRSASLTQTIHSGNSSSNIQVGRDAHIVREGTMKDVSED